MDFKVVNQDNNKGLFNLIIIALIFFVFILPKIEKCYNKEESVVLEKMDRVYSPIDSWMDLNNDIKDVTAIKQSRDCVSNVQYPAGTSGVITKGSNNTPNNILAGSTGSCPTPNYMSYLAARGGNVEEIKVDTAEDPQEVINPNKILQLS